MLRNVRVRYDQVEDRLILGLTTVSGAVASEHLVALTRRLWVDARKDLLTLIEVSASPPQHLEPGVQKMISAAHHQAVAAKTELHHEARPTQPMPPAQLATGLRCGRRRGDESWVIVFVLVDKAELTLVVSDKTLHALINALVRCEATTGWGLPPLPLTAPPAAAAPAGLH